MLDIICWNCNKKGHPRRLCPDYRDRSRGRGEEGRGGTNGGESSRGGRGFRRGRGFRGGRQFRGRRGSRGGRGARGGWKKYVFFLK